jgi:hypothetical protein
MTRTFLVVGASLTALSLAVGPISRAYASTGHTSNSGTLQRLFISENGTIRITLGDLPSTAEDCGPTKYYFIPSTHQQRDEFLSTLLMAWQSRQRVNFRVRDPHTSGTECEVVYMVLDR